MFTGKKNIVSGLMGILGFISLVAFGDAVYAKNNYKVLQPNTKTPSKDTDQDGLTDKEERKLKTNPKDADTDHDGLSDGLEVKTLKTDPKSADSDDDGIDDGDEVADGTNPTDVDSDDDGIDDSEDDNNHSADSSKYDVTLVPTSNTFTFKNGEVEIDGKDGVKIKMEIDELQDANGNPVTNTGNTLFIDYILDGVQNIQNISFDSNEGKVKTGSNLGLSGQILSINNIILLDSENNSFASPGIKIGGSDDGDDDDDDDDDDDTNHHSH